MKKISALLLICSLSATVVFASDLTEADQKWKEAVEKKISAGSTTISTPSEQRVEIAKSVAEKYGRKVEVAKTENGYRVTCKTSEVAGE